MPAKGSYDSAAGRAKMNPKTLPIVKNFGRKNEGQATTGLQAMGLSELEEHDYEVGVKPNPPMSGRRMKKRKKVRKNSPYKAGY
jgi:hypothetical protein